MSSRTRKEAQQERRRREAEEKRRQQHPQASTSGYLGPTGEHGIIESATNLQYNIYGLPNPVKLTAQRGLAADNIGIERARMHVSTAHDPYIGLQIVERLRLCIYNLPKDGRKLECSCAEFITNKPKICSHIYVSQKPGQAQYFV